MNRRKRILKKPFEDYYQGYILQAKRKGRTIEEVNDVIFWLTGYNEQALKQHISNRSDMETFFDQAPQINPNVKKVLCCYHTAKEEDTLIQQIFHLDDLIYGLIQGKFKQILPSIIINDVNTPSDDDNRLLHSSTIDVDVRPNICNLEVYLLDTISLTQSDEQKILSGKGYINKEYTQNICHNCKRLYDAVMEISLVQLQHLTCDKCGDTQKTKSNITKISRTRREFEFEVCIECEKCRKKKTWGNSFLNDLKYELNLGILKVKKV